MLVLWLQALSLAEADFVNCISDVPKTVRHSELMDCEGPALSPWSLAWNDPDSLCMGTEWGATWLGCCHAKDSAAVMSQRAAWIGCLGIMAVFFQTFCEVDPCYCVKLWINDIFPSEVNISLFSTEDQPLNCTQEQSRQAHLEACMNGRLHEIPKYIPVVQTL